MGDAPERARPDEGTLPPRLHGVCVTACSVQDEPVKQANVRGRVSFAKTGAPDSRSTQLFINFGDNSRLDGMGFSPFAEIEGMGVVDSINACGEKPNQAQIQARAPRGCAPPQRASFVSCVREVRSRRATRTWTTAFRSSRRSYPRASSPMMRQAAFRSCIVLSEVAPAAAIERNACSFSEIVHNISPRGTAVAAQCCHNQARPHPEAPGNTPPAPVRAR